MAKPTPPHSANGELEWRLDCGASCMGKHRKGLVAGFLVICAAVPAMAQSAIGFHLERTQPLSRFDAGQKALLEELNRADANHLAHLREIVVPDRWDSNPLAYSPMPQQMTQLSADPKAIVIDLPGQVFGAYENGRLVRWGAVCSGDADHPTPPGTYHLNWKAREHVSSFNQKWVMPYTFNFQDHLGLDIHEYALDGTPSSHGCVRTLGPDAQWIFDWGQPGTPVLIVGQYNFAAAPPWLAPQWWAQGVQLSVGEAARAR